MKNSRMTSAVVYTLLMIGLSAQGTAQQPKKTGKTETFLNKLFHNRASEDVLELGSVVFYFSEEPEMVVLPTKKTAQHHQVSYFFKGTKLTNTAREMIGAFYEGDHAGYQVSVNPAKTGLKVTISYDPNKVDLSEDPKWYITHDKQQGFIIRLNNKTLLSKLNKQGGFLLRTASLQKPKVVVDCGHGGIDIGTLGCNKMAEKELTLEVGLQVAELLKKDGYDVVLTRNNDATVALDQRTTLANMQKADLFVSIHANYAAKKTASGIETFCITDSLFKPCFGNSSDDLNAVRKARNALSHTLAQNIQKHTLHSVKKKYVNVMDRGVKHEATQVLVGTTMPAALIEIGFLSNEDEARRLVDIQYQCSIAQGIKNGIDAFDQAMRRTSNC